MKEIKKIPVILALFFVFGCDTESLDPTLEQIKDISSVATAADMDGILKGALNRMTDDTYYGRDFIITDEVRGDNVFANGSSGRFQTQATMEYIPTNGLGVWARAYEVIANCNIIIGVDVSGVSDDPDFASHIQGQALMIRALAHLDLMRNYGQQYTGGTLGVPIVTGFKDDLYPARNTVDEVKAAIYSDLEAAFNAMDDAFDVSPEYPTRMAAKAIESRTAIYFGDWSRAASAAQMVINSGSYSIAAPNEFLASFANDNASNSIFELSFSDVDNQGSNSLGFIYRTTDGGVYGDIEVLPAVENFFEATDVRRTDILGFEGTMLRNMGKYPNINGFDNVSVIRYEEVILNYAEALWRQNNSDPDALTQLNLIPAQRGASPYALIDEDVILDERRRELMFEGFRFFDLSRMGRDVEKVSNLQNLAATVSAGDYRYALPIPLTEMDANSNMDQNTGY